MIPTNWNDVTLESYVPYRKTFEEYTEEQVEKMTPEAFELARLDLRIKRACLLANVEPEEILKLTQEELLKVDDLEKIPIPTKIAKSFRINGQTYKPQLDPRKYTGGEYMAVMNACKDKGSDNIHRILFLVCKPVNVWGKEIKFEAHEIEARMNDFKKLPVSIAYPIALFFWNLSRVLTDATLDYSSELMKKQREEMEAAYLAATDGL